MHKLICSMTRFENIKVIYIKYIDQLYAYALHLGFDEAVAMDAIHDIFYNICTHNTCLDNISNIKFYLFRALKNRLIDIERTHKDYIGIGSTNQDICENMLFSFNITIEDKVIQEEDLNEIKQKVENVLARLTNRQREIIYLRYIQEYDYDEISDLMNISVESCRNLISKAMSKLRENPLLFSQLITLIIAN